MSSGNVKKGAPGTAAMKDAKKLPTNNISSRHIPKAYEACGIKSARSKDDSSAAVEEKPIKDQEFKRTSMAPNDYVAMDGTSSVRMSQINEKGNVVKARTGPWLHAWTDPVANLKAYSQCMTTSDLEDNGEFSLLVADSKKILKVYNGTTLRQTFSLLSDPISLVAFYSDDKSPRYPSIAVACANSIYTYRNMRPYYRFQLPVVKADEKELEAWQRFNDRTIDASMLIQMLDSMKQAGTKLTEQSVSVLALRTPESKVKKCQDYRNVEPADKTTITVMKAMADSREGMKEMSCLVVGAENGLIHVLTPQGSTIRKSVQLPGIPCHLAVLGQYQVDWRIAVACRNGNVYQIKNGKLMGAVIRVGRPIVGVGLYLKNVLIGSCDSTVKCYHVKGHKKFSVWFNSPPTELQVVTMTRHRDKMLWLVSLRNGEVHFYNAQDSIAVLPPTNARIAAMKFGPYGREEAALILVNKIGELFVKILQRKATFERSKDGSNKPDIEPLKMPPVTQLALDSTKRELGIAQVMHSTFQRDLCRLRVKTTRAYVQVIKAGMGPMAHTGKSLRVNAVVQGLGPSFLLHLELKNTGKKSIAKLPVLFLVDFEVYKMNSCLEVPLLIPGLTYKFQVRVLNISKHGVAPPIRVVIVNPRSSTPFISAVIEMPMPANEFQ